MDRILEKSFTESRALLFGFLQGCIFSEYAMEDCPLSRLRRDLSINQKYDFALEASDEAVNAFLRQHEKCIAKRGATYMKG